VDLAFEGEVEMGNHDYPMIPRLYWFAEEAQGKSIEVDGEVVAVVRPSWGWQRGRPARRRRRLSKR
jgi:hypothetical protein